MGFYAKAKIEALESFKALRCMLIQGAIKDWLYKDKKWRRICSNEFSCFCIENDIKRQYFAPCTRKQKWSYRKKKHDSYGHDSFHAENQESSQSFLG